jgi:hypothetical protein
MRVEEGGGAGRAASGVNAVETKLLILPRVALPKRLRTLA